MPSGDFNAESPIAGNPAAHCSATCLALCLAINISLLLFENPYLGLNHIISGGQKGSIPILLKLGVIKVDYAVEYGVFIICSLSSRRYGVAIDALYDIR